MEYEKENKLIFQGLVKEYGKKRVIDGLDGKIVNNRITSLIGPNGAGKSTLLSILSRLLKQDGGEVSFMDKPLHAYKSNELAQKLSILKQSNQTDVKLTVKDLVAFGRFPYSKGRMTETDWQKVQEAIAFSDLEDLTEAYIDELSGGQRQRAFISMIIAQDTEYILLDEPLNNLDMKHSVHVMKTLRRLVDELGKTVVIVIHEINFAAQYSDYVIAMKDGEIRYSDEVNNIIRPETLQEIFGIEFDIIEKNNKKICNYFNI
jgi:iron complex transport system ATP-binding protein